MGFALALAGGFTLTFASAAKAGPVEQLVQVSLHPKDPKVLALRHEYGGEGLFISRDSGKSWGYVCNGYIDPSQNARRGTLQVAPDGSVLLGVFDGVWHSDGKGCSWKLDEGLLNKWVPDITADPIDPEVLYAVTSNGDPGMVNGIMRRDASGAWSDLGEKQEMLITRLRVVKNGDAVRFYESAVKGTLKAMVNGMEMEVANYLVRVSDDDGATFEEFPFAAPDMGSFKLLAVDPSNPDRVVAWIDRDASGQHDDSVLISNDKGESFTEYKTFT
ncbi:MAG TPA: hypothetical protein VK509_22080, partial [Polyangiales bacterium]|nr:hypothetical protein [Polyangiales bacterium]